jgi:hypothetical protein
MLTGAVKDNFEADPRFARYEYSVPDVNKFSYLARQRRQAGVLGVATGGMPEQSARYRDLLSPLGIRDELRLSFVADGECWGACSLYRDAESSDFTDDDAATAAALSGVLAEGVRRALLVCSPVPTMVSDGPGVVLLDSADQVRSVSPTAQRMLSTVVDVGPGADDRLPAAVYAVAAASRAAAVGDETRMARVHVPTAASAQSSSGTAVHAGVVNAETFPSLSRARTRKQYV